MHELLLFLFIYCIFIVWHGFFLFFVLLVCSVHKHYFLSMNFNRLYTVIRWFLFINHIMSYSLGGNSNASIIKGRHSVVCFPRVVSCDRVRVTNDFHLLVNLFT